MERRAGPEIASLSSFVFSYFRAFVVPRRDSEVAFSGRSSIQPLKALPDRR
jgi:hypothetical protein